MSVLTKRERCLLTGAVVGTVGEKNKAIRKMEKFQHRLANNAYVEAINSLIPEAERVAREEAKNNLEFTAIFHSKMNSMARAKGLRQY